MGNSQGQLTPACERSIGTQGAVSAAIVDAPLYLLDTSTGFEMFVTLLVERWPVGDVTKEASDLGVR